MNSDETNQPYNNLSAEEILQEMRNRLLEMKCELKEERRCLDLMEAGLKERPLDQDFFDKKQLEYIQHEQMFLVAQRLNGFVSERKNQNDKTT